MSQDITVVLQMKNDGSLDQGGSNVCRKKQRCLRDI